MCTFALLVSVLVPVSNLWSCSWVVDHWSGLITTAEAADGTVHGSPVQNNVGILPSAKPEAAAAHASTKKKTRPDPRLDLR